MIPGSDFAAEVLEGGWCFVEVQVFICLFRNVSSTNCSFPEVLFDREICWCDRFIANRIFIGVCFIGKALMLLQNLVLSESLLSPDKECVWIGSFSWSPWAKRNSIKPVDIWKRWSK